MQYRLTLDYHLPPGWLQPWVEAILEGRALARECLSCGHRSFAPLRVCRCGSTGGRWCELSGRCQVLIRTDGVDGEFGLVKFEGADTSVVARLQGFTPCDSRGRLARPGTSKPAIVIEPSGEG